METLRRTVYDITEHAQKAVKEMDKESFDDCISILKEAHSKFDGRSVFTVGKGRSGAVTRMFTARLGHLGYRVTFVEDTYIPPLREDDIVIAVSGSGTTTGVVSYAKATKEKGAKVLAVTSNKNSPLGKLADKTLYIPGRKIEEIEEESYLTRQVKNAPMGTLFEDSALLMLEGLIAALRERLGEPVEEMEKRHATVQ